MKQRVSYTMTVSFDILMQDIPDDTTHENIVEALGDIKNSLERQVAQELSRGCHYFNTKVILTKLPQIS